MILFNEQFINNLTENKLKKFINKYGINYIDDYNRTLLTQTIIANNIKLIKLLLLNDININYNNNMGFSPLFLAIYFNNTKIVKLLLKHNVNIKCKHFIYFTPLKYTLVYKQYKYTKMLIKKYIDNNDISWQYYIKMNEFKLFKIHHNFNKCRYYDILINRFIYMYY